MTSNPVSIFLKHLPEGSGVVMTRSGSDEIPFWFTVPFAGRTLRLEIKLARELIEQDAEALVPFVLANIESAKKWAVG